jgi:hypothetical protein
LTRFLGWYILGVDKDSSFNNQSLNHPIHNNHDGTTTIGSGFLIDGNSLLFQKRPPPEISIPSQSSVRSSRRGELWTDDWAGIF